MATAAAPRNDVYLSVLAGRAVTALADLAGDPSAWTPRIELGLRDGIAYCKTVRAQDGSDVSPNISLGWVALKRSVEDTHDECARSCDLGTESADVERFFSLLLAREHRPELTELAAAIQFLRKTATDY
ncbi:MAG TPA: hypothetical protein VI386_24575 [Candidatus Sulfotelmatobacter sp.]